MNIPKISNTPVSQNFKGKIPKELSQIVSTTNVSKNLTELDRWCFKRYIDSMPYRTGVNQAEIKNLEKLDGADFVYACKDLILRKIGIPEKVRPELYIADSIAGESPMVYMSNNNIIACDKAKIATASKAEIFGLIRHECQHFLQNTSVLRHERLGTSAINKMTKSYIEQEKLGTRAIFENCSDEQIQQMFAQQPETLNFLMQAKILTSKGDTKAFDTLFEANGEEYKKQLLSFQATLKDSMGVIHDDSPLTPKIAKYADELFNIDYYNKNGEIDYKKYLNYTIEQEALNAQLAGGNEFDYKTCPMKNLKKSMEDFFADEELVNKLKQN